MRDWSDIVRSRVPPLLRDLEASRTIPPDAYAAVTNLLREALRTGRFSSNIEDEVQDYLLERFGVTWPVCPRHGRHPLSNAERPPRHVWFCRRDRDVEFEISALPVMEREPLVVVPPGTVRWFDDKRGLGLIAGDMEDVWVIFRTIEGEGFRRLAEDDRVEYELDSGRQGVLLRARRVWKAGPEAQA